MEQLFPFRVDFSAIMETVVSIMRALGHLLGALVLFSQAPAKGLENSPFETEFPPPQRSLTSAFLKLASSLEETGSPRSYIEHVLSENSRVASKYVQTFGQKVSFRPPYLTRDYVVSLLNEWEKLERPLQLKELSTESGKHLRIALLGSWQKRPLELANDETKLSADEKKEFLYFLRKTHFDKSDQAKLNSFYRDEGPFDRLSKPGKDQMTLRGMYGSMSVNDRQKALKKEVSGTILIQLLNDYQNLLLAERKKRGKRKTNTDTLEKLLVKAVRFNEEVKNLDQYSQSEQDAIWHSHMIRALFRSRFSLFEGKVSPEGERSMKRNLTLMVDNLLVLVHLEFTTALIEEEVNAELSRR